MDNNMQALVDYYNPPNRIQQPPNSPTITGLAGHMIVGGLIGRFLGSLIDRRRNSR